ncbi:MAG TPA: glycosyltransferase family 2 protein [Ignavibacteria bacterium]|nr:glycosyltransferase family 2 protein [Ignavibacteria bacterium]HMQ97570.1 glycosyltransferase family 2 protein [Ignavibacteria bacterium]
MSNPESNSEISCSIVIPVFCNELNIEPTFNKINDVVIKKNPHLMFEIIFVDDGSYDNSLEKLIELKKSHEGLIKIIKFTRNFGQVNAIYAGYSRAKGKCIVNISADLQDSPELINEMFKYYFEENYPIVICTRSDRDESFARRTTSKMFYAAMRKLSFSNMPAGGFDFLLIDQKVKSLLLSNMEANAFWQGQILWTGYKVKFIPYTRQKREIGESKWTFSKKLKYLIDGVLGYSFLPIRLMSILGLLISLSGFVYSIFIVIAKFTGNVPFQGWAPLMILVLLLSGFQMLMLGIIGEYLWRTLDEVRRRQAYVIESFYD